MTQAVEIPVGETGGPVEPQTDLKHGLRLFYVGGEEQAGLVCTDSKDKTKIGREITFSATNKFYLLNETGRDILSLCWLSGYPDQQTGQHERIKELGVLKNGSALMITEDEFWELDFPINYMFELSWFDGKKSTAGFEYRMFKSTPLYFEPVVGKNAYHIELTDFDEICR